LNQTSADSGIPPRFTQFGNCSKGIAGDLKSARTWYERAAKSGNAKATERLKILASLSETGPSD